MNPRLAKPLVDRMLRRIRVGTLVVIEPGGVRHEYGHGSPEATIRLESELAWGLFLWGSLRLADGYADGLWDSPDLVALVRLAARNMPALDRLRRWALPLQRPLQLFRALRRENGRAQRRRDVAAHYDLGNELFRRMLDPTLTYSCALFEHKQMTLEEAQLAKLELVCQKLDLRRTDRVLEIGSGWGSFALHAASTRGCHVTTTTLSQEQHQYLTEEVVRRGLTDRVTVLSQDFRDLRGRYDKVVSIEMIEAVGWRNVGRFLEHCSRLLEADGAMLLQAITIDDRAYELEKASRSFIKEYIFPGGSLPSLATLTAGLAARTDLQTLDVHDITAHYAETLRRWREAFLAHSQELAGLGYDERFQRIWKLYLAYCEGGFAERRICDVQMLLGKPKHRLPSLSGSHAGWRPEELERAA